MGRLSLVSVFIPIACLFRRCSPFVVPPHARLLRFKSPQATEQPFTELNIEKILEEQRLLDERIEQEPSSGGSDFSPFEESKVQHDHLQSGGLVERWEELGGNFILRPPPNVPERAVLHFIGGAFVGAAPHVTYRYLLQGFANAGYLVVATPYNLAFDYLEVCDSILERFETIAPMLAEEYGALPVVGMGHSCGALLQVLITCLFPGTPRAANALISFNNKQVTDAIPGFKQLVQPFAAQAMSKTSSEAASLRSSVASLREFTDQVLAELLEATQATTDDVTASDGPAANPGTSTSRGAAATSGCEGGVEEARRATVQAVGSALASAGKAIAPTAPSAVAASAAQRAGAAGGAGVGDESPPTGEGGEGVDRPDVVGRRLVDVRESLKILDQIPPLLSAIAEGVTEFSPTPDDTKAACRRMYRARKTLIVKFENDLLDESEELAEVIREGKEMTRLKRPTVNFDIRFETITGDHITPLTQDVFLETDVLRRVPQGPEAQEAAREAFLRTVDDTHKVLLAWLEEV